ncbi:hypothetical protein AAZV13_05G079500 [Glycine max]
MDFSSIPIIDISSLLAKADDQKMGEDPGVLEVVRQLDKACSEAGFLYVKGHGVPEALLKEVRDVTRRYFELPYEEKAKIKMTPATGFRFNMLGYIDLLCYQRIGENITKGVLDMHEAIDCYREVSKGMYGDLGKVMEGSNQWHAFSPFHHVSHCNLEKKIMRGIALALGGSPNEFEGQRAGDPFWVMPLIGYPGVSSVRNLSGKWISASPVPRTFLCNIGNILKIYSNGLYESTLHQMINNNSKYRVSVIYFYETNFDTTVSHWTHKMRANDNMEFKRAVYGEHLIGKVLTNFVDL